MVIIAIKVFAVSILRETATPRLRKKEEEFSSIRLDKFN